MSDANFEYFNGISEHSSNLFKEGFKEDVGSNDFRLLMSMLEVTDLEPNASRTKILELCKKVISSTNSDYPAGVCVFPHYADLVKSELDGTGVKTVSVAGGFPYGATTTKAAINECVELQLIGVDELDIVINKGLFASKEYQKLESSLREIISSVTIPVKVILESGDLSDYSDIATATNIAINAGARFVKTSTGKTPIGATPFAVYAICKEVYKHYHNTGEKIGIKISGGVKNLKTANGYLNIVKNTLDQSWLTPKYLRFGASSLYDEILSVSL